MSMPLCQTCGIEPITEILTPCPVCGGQQEHGDADCWFCCGMGQQAVNVCRCPGGTPEAGEMSRKAIEALTWIGEHCDAEDAPRALAEIQQLAVVAIAAIKEYAS